MSRRSGIPDPRSAGRSSLVPFKQGEQAKRRHQRRLSVNLDNQKKAQAWCAENGYTFRITNDGHHWQFSKGDFLAEWWPSSAKLVLNKRWDSGIHCHDFQQAIRTIEKYFAQFSQSRGPGQRKEDSQDIRAHKGDALFSQHLKQDEP